MAGFRADRRSTPTYEDVSWTIEDEDYLADVVAVVALGQASHAATLISRLDPVAAAFSTAELRDAAISSLEIDDGTEEEMASRRWQRDGLLFEVLSWAALVETHVGEHFLVRAPHLGSTTQGLDGLLLELDSDSLDIRRTVILEDKCSEHPRRTFRSQVMPAFHSHHRNERAPDLVATAANLLSRLVDGSGAVMRASAVLDLSRRGYRASLAIDPTFDASPSRRNLFNGYDSLAGMLAANREGGGFVVGEDLRTWFDQFALRVRRALERIELSDIV